MRRQDNDCSLCFCSFGQNGNGLAGNGKTFGQTDKQRDRMMCMRERERVGRGRVSGKEGDRERVRQTGVATTCNR